MIRGREVLHLEVSAIVVAVGLLGLLALPACDVQWGEDGRQRSCAMNLKQLGQSFALYATEHDGVYPPMQRKVGPECEPNAGVLMFDWEMMAPEYVQDADLLLCPSDDDAQAVREERQWGQGASDKALACLVDDTSYTYLGWFPARVDAGGEDFSHPYATGVGWLFAQPDDVRTGLFARDFETESTVDAPVELLRLGTDTAERAGVTADRIPVMMDRFYGMSSVGMSIPGPSMSILRFNHLPGGSNVLYLDGHVSFVQYPAYPVTLTMAGFLGGMDARRPASMHRKMRDTLRRQGFDVNAAGVSQFPSDGRVP